MKQQFKKICIAGNGCIITFRFCEYVNLSYMCYCVCFLCACLGSVNERKAVERAVRLTKHSFTKILYTENRVTILMDFMKHALLFVLGEYDNNFS